MCPVKVKESLLDHASVGRILSCGNTIYSQIILVITCKMHGFPAEPSCPVSASNAKQPAYRDYLKLALTNDLYAAEALSSTKTVGFHSPSLCLADTPGNCSITLCPVTWGLVSLCHPVPLQIGERLRISLAWRIE